MSDLYCEAGGFADAPLSTARQRDLRRQARQWLDQARPLLETLSNPTSTAENSKDAITLLRAYDMMHRVAHGAPDPDYIRRIRLNLVQRWARGDRSLSQTEIALMIADEIDRDISTLPARYITFYLDLQSRWIRELAAHGTFPGLPAEETYLRLARLLRTDISATTGRARQADLKRRWTRAHLLPPATLSTLPPAARRAYTAFTRAMP